MTMAICIMDFVLFSPTETADEIKLEVRKLQTVLSKLPIAFFISNDELKYFPPYPLYFVPPCSSRVYLPKRACAETRKEEVFVLSAALVAASVRWHLSVKPGYFTSRVSCH